MLKVNGPEICPLKQQFLINDTSGIVHTRQKPVRREVKAVFWVLIAACQTRTRLTVLSQPNEVTSL